jgi:predicted phosphodiesterase
MKIKYISDLHLEFVKPTKINKYVELIHPDLDCVLILAGDIGNPYSSNYDIFMNYVSKSFKKIFVIAGNHEFYSHGKTIEDTIEFMQSYFKKFDNITFLNNSYENYEGYNFIGSTLWSQITNPEFKINDLGQIKNLTVEKYNNLNKECFEFLNSCQLDNQIMITHHVPSYSLIDKKFKVTTMEPYNQWFYCNMDNYIETNKDKIKLWFYGHTHVTNKTKINDTEFLCNPIGYLGENYKVDFNQTIDI